MSADIIQLRDGGTLTSELQDALYKVICADKYEKLTVAQTVGVLEFLKWNLINGS